MNWSDERYVRLYTRDTTTWKLLGWEARTVLLHLLRKVDRAGVLDVGDDGMDGLIAVLELPQHVVEAGIAQLERRSVVLFKAHAYVMPNFLAAQEAVASDKQRQRDMREKRRAESLVSHAVTPRDEVITPCDETVTAGHATSRAVTPSLAVPISDQMPDESGKPKPTKVSRAKPRQKPDGQEPTDVDRAYASARGIDTDHEWPRMLDWHRANKPDGSADWRASWRTWVGNAVKYGRGGAVPPAQPVQRRLYRDL